MNTHIVTTADAGLRLDRWFKRHRADIPHSLLQKLLRKGVIRINNKKTKADYRLQESDHILLPSIEERQTKPVTRIFAITQQQRDSLLKNALLYEDENLLAINKPAGLATQGGSKIGISVDAILQDANKRNGTALCLVHRLDKDTSGVLLIAKNPQIASDLGALFKHRNVAKTYWAISTGVPRAREGRIALPLAKGRALKNASPEKMMVDEESGKPAVTEYRIIEALGDKLAWVELQPRTGRTHQLRVHMAAIGHPILGDGKYGGKKAFIQGLGNRLHLHARSIQLKGISITAPLPLHMQETWNLLGFKE